MESLWEILKEFILKLFILNPLTLQQLLYSLISPPQKAQIVQVEQILNMYL